MSLASPPFLKLLPHQPQPISLPPRLPCLPFRQVLQVMHSSSPPTSFLPPPTLSLQSSRSCPLDSHPKPASTSHHGSPKPSWRSRFQCYAPIPKPYPRI